MDKKKFSYDSAMQELEEIVKHVESGECKMDELTSEVKKAASLIALCKKKLQDIDTDTKASCSDILE